MVFENPFFSISGQVERIKNVGAVLSQSLNPFSKEKPTANVSNTILKSGLEIAASHPILTGLAAGSIISGAAASTLAATSLKTKIIGGTAAAIITPAILTSPKALSVSTEVIKNVQPARLGKDIGTVIENPSLENIKNLVTENKASLGVIGGTAAVLGGIAAASTLTTLSNTNAIKENTKASQNILVDTSRTDYSQEEIMQILKQRMEETTQPQIINIIPSQPITPTPTIPIENNVVPSKKIKKKAKKKKNKVYKKKKTTKKKKSKSKIKKRK